MFSALLSGFSERIFPWVAHSSQNLYRSGWRNVFFRWAMQFAQRYTGRWPNRGWTCRHRQSHPLGLRALVLFKVAVPGFKLANLAFEVGYLCFQRLFS